MLIIGAGGLAAQLFEEAVNLQMQDLVFWSETPTKYKFIERRYSILNTDEQVVAHFKERSQSFVLCISNPEQRKNMAIRFQQLGGELSSYISPKAEVSPYDVTIERGVTILAHTVIEAGVTIKEGCLLNKKSNIAHGTSVSSYCEISPEVILTGEVEVGENCFIGTGTIVLPKVRIGRNSVIAAGAVIKKNIPEFSLVSGGTSRVVKTLKAK